MSVWTDDSGPVHRPRWWAWLQHELAPLPGRELATMRIVVTVALVTVISLALQVPELAISAYMVIFVTKENRVLTKLAGVLAIVGITVAIAVSLVLYGVTFDYPALRLPVMALTVFAGMYLARTFVVGPLGFAVGFVVAVTQSAADGVPTPEMLVRALLWLWVALVYPIVLTVIVNQILAPAEPWAAFVGALMRRLDAASAALRRASEEGVVGGRRDPALLETATRGSGPLLKLLHFAEGKDVRSAHRHSSLVAAVTASERIVRAAAVLELGNRQTLSADDRAYAGTVHAGIAEMRSVLPSRSPGMVGVAFADAVANSPELHELGLAAAALADSLAHEEPTDPNLTRMAGAKKTLFVPGAFTDPSHVRFALKVTLAAMGCYVVYNSLDWSGIHTAFITCCIIALESNGATRRKAWLRLAGCGVGGLLGFLSILYLVPLMESIVSLVLLVSAVTALAGWVAAGSERVAYGGLQIALAFYLCVFQGFAPGTDFDKIRDRLAGIILGIVVSGIVFRYVWPEHAGDRLRAALARVLHSLGRLVLIPAADASGQAAVEESTREQSVITKDLDETLRLKELAILEGTSVDRADALSPARLDGIVRQVQAVFLIASTLTNRLELDAWVGLAPSGHDTEAVARGNVARRLHHAGDAVAAAGLLSVPEIENEPPKPRRPLVPEPEGRRALLVSRLEEQTRRLVEFLSVG